MNPIEKIKAERDGLAVLDDLPSLATKGGWEEIDPADRERLKWTGWFYRKPTPRRFMVRVRTVGGRLTADQLEALAAIAEEFGSGRLDLTTRQGVEVRDTKIADAPAIHARLAAAGLTSLQTGMDNVRSVMTCPLAGVNPHEAVPAHGVADEITRTILRNRAFTNLPRKVNVAVTGCTRNCVPAETQDIALVPARSRNGARGFHVLVGGKQGSGGMTVARPLGVFVERREAAALARAILEIYRDHGPRRERNRCRLAFLLEAWGMERFRAEVGGRYRALAGRDLDEEGLDLRLPDAREDHLGVQRQWQDGLYAVGLATPTGRVASRDLRDLAAAARRYGSAEVRLTPDQNVVIVGVAEERLADLLSSEIARRFPHDPAPAFRGLVTCTGTDYCNLALIESKAIGEAVSRALDEAFGRDLPPLTIRWSGCPAGCGNHRSADLGFQGVKVMAGGRAIEAVHIYVGGRGGPEARRGRRILEGVPVSMLGEIVPMIVRNLRLLEAIRDDRTGDSRVLMIPTEVTA